MTLKFSGKFFGILKQNPDRVSGHKNDQPLISVLKSTLAKVIGKALLFFDELRRFLLDTEVYVINRPLCWRRFRPSCDHAKIIGAQRPGAAVDESIVTDEDLDCNANDRFLQKNVRTKFGNVGHVNTSI